VRARQLLEFSNRTVKEMAWAVGYADAGAFSRVFAKVAGVSPGRYRRRFAAVGRTAVISSSPQGASA
jgi:transcriptional regulator GlxA family with amidase domain